MTNRVHPRASHELWASGQLGRFVLLCLGVWLHAADSLVTATLVPAIVDDIGGIAYVGWTISLYQTGAIVAGATAAMLCQRLGIERVSVLAACLYGSGCAMAALAPDIAILLGARLVQGAGGGMLLSLSYVAIQQSFAEPLWARLFGVIAAIWGAGALLGPLIGGVFADMGAWRGAFWLFAVQAGVLAALVKLLLPTETAGKAAAGRWPWLPLLPLAAAVLLIGQAGVAAHAVAAIVECLMGAGLLYLAGRLDRQAKARLLPRQALDLRHPVGAGLVTVFLLSLATTGFWAYGPLILKILFSTDPLISGYILAGESLAWSAATIATSGAPLAAGRTLIRTGAALVAIGAAGFAVAVPAGSLAGMVTCALAQGVGFGLCWPSIVGRVVGCSDPAERGLASASPGIVQAIGYALGAAATGIAANLSGLAEGVSAATAKAAGFWIFAGFIPFLILGALGAWHFASPHPRARIKHKR